MIEKEPDKSLVGVDVGRDRLDARAGAAGDDRDRRGRGDRHLAAEALHHAHVRGVGAGAPFLGEHQRRLVDLGADMLEDFACSTLGHRPLERDVARLEEGVEAHHAEADAALALGANTWRGPFRPGRGRCNRCRTLSRKRITSSMNPLSPCHSSQVSRLKLA